MENFFIFNQIQDRIQHDDVIFSITSENYHNIKEISFFSGRSIKVAPHNQVFNRFINLKTLHLRFFRMTKLTKELFVNIDLEELEILHCGLEEIDQDAFFNQKKLKKLDFSHNNVSQILPGTFDNLKMLQELRFSHNLVKDLKEKLFLNLKNLKILDICSNGLIELKNTTLNGLKYLEELDIGFNDCVYGSKSLVNLKKLKTLKLYYTHTGLPISQTKIIAPTKLERLDYVYERKTSPHLNNISQIANLKILNLESLELAESFFSRYKNLEEVHLKFIEVSIHSFPKNMVTVKKLILESVTFVNSTYQLFADIKPEEVQLIKCKFKTPTDISKLVSTLTSARKISISTKNCRDDFQGIKMNESVTKNLQNLEELYLGKMT